jgi:hypothetical protein
MRLQSYFRKHNRIDDLPKKTLDNVAFGFWYADGYGIFNSKFVYRPGGILGSTSIGSTCLTIKKVLSLFNTDATNLYEMSEQLYLISTGQKLLSQI